MQGFGSLAGLPRLECTGFGGQWDYLGAGIRDVAANGWDFELAQERGLFALSHALLSKYQDFDRYTAWCILLQELGLGEITGTCEGDIERANGFCLLGALSAGYLTCWELFEVNGERAAGNIRETLAKMMSEVRMNDFDLFQETLSWRDISTWDWAINMRRVMLGELFQPRADLRPRHARQRIGNGWGPSDAQASPLLVMPHVWPWLPPERLFAQACSEYPGQSAADAGAVREVKVWWISAHPSIFLDVLDSWQQEGPPAFHVTIEHNLLPSYHCESMPLLCIQNPLLAEVLRAYELALPLSPEQRSNPVGANWKASAWKDAESVIEGFDAVVGNFAQHFGHALIDVDVFICGHPLYLCRLFETPAFRKKPVLGVLDMPWAMRVPEHLHQQWAERLSIWIADATHVAVAASAFPAMQLAADTGLRVAFSRHVGFGLIGPQWYPIEPYKVVLTRSPNNWQNILLQSVAHLMQVHSGTSTEKLPFALDFVRWPEDLQCTGPLADLIEASVDRSSCSIEDIAKFRAAIVWPYDMQHYKMFELYALGMPMFVHDALWRWTARWAMMQPHRELSFDMPMQLSTHCTESFLGSMWDRRLGGKLVDAERLLSGGLPCPPHTPNRWRLEPVGAAFWAEFSEFAQRPHLHYFASAADLLGQLYTLGLSELTIISSRMRRWHREVAGQASRFWRALFARLLAAPSCPHALDLFKGG